MGNIGNYRMEDIDIVQNIGIVQNRLKARIDKLWNNCCISFCIKIVTKMLTRKIKLVKNNKGFNNK